MKKALTAPAIHFKGSGWAKKDAKAPAAAPATSAAKKDDAPSRGRRLPPAASGGESAGTGRASRPRPADRDPGTRHGRQRQLTSAPHRVGLDQPGGRRGDLRVRRRPDQHAARSLAGRRTASSRASARVG